MGESKDAYFVLVRETEGNNPFGRPKDRLGIILK
jgi:hypothetical protein